jgi:endonuclease/exonuclease/phosphatase family metal-dependent hydrolase
MTHLRIATYNVQSFLGYPPEAARRALGRGNTVAAAAHFAHALSVLGCEVLALQEGVTERQVTRVAAALGMQYATFPSPLYWPGHLLSRFPISEVVHFAPPRSRGSRRLSSADARPFSRMAGAARLTLPAGDALWVMAIHLHPSDQEVRQQEGMLVGAHVRSLLADASRVVVLGDFNCEPGESVHQALDALGFANAMIEAGGGLQATYDSTGIIAYRVDHIYVSPALRPALVGAETVRTPGFWHDGPLAAGAWLHSDHVPLVAELDLAH